MTIRKEFPAITNHSAQGLLEAAITMFYTGYNRFQVLDEQNKSEKYNFEAHNFSSDEGGILFIPPNGTLKNFDFSIFRIAAYLKKNNIKTAILSFEPPSAKFYNLFTRVYTPRTVTEFFDLLSTIKRSRIFYRGWMHAYIFGAFLVKTYSDTIINIKDWNFCDQERYRFLFGELSCHDFAGIDYIFRRAEVIFSHYTAEETNKWAEEYICNPQKFIFLPELCDESSFCEPVDNSTDIISLVWATSLPPTCFPEDMFPTRTIFSDTRLLSKELQIDYIVSEGVYEKILREKKQYLDILYESQFNPYFNLIKGGALSPHLLRNYHYGFFMFSDSIIDLRLIKYAIPSKFAFYMEAGLPILVNEKNKSMAELVTEYGIGILFSDGEVAQLPYKLRNYMPDYREMIMNVCSFRKGFTYQALGIPGLV